MRKTILCSSICMMFVAAGVLGYERARPAEPADPGAASTQPRSPGGASRARTPPGTTAPRMATAGARRVDRAAMAPGAPSSGEHFPDTPVGRALDSHLRTLVDVNPGADDRKQRSLEELRRHPREVSQALLDAYHDADRADYFGRWLISLTLWEVRTDEAYRGLQEIARSAIPAGLKDNDREGSALANESAIRQNAAEGLAALARAGNAEAERDLLSLALDPPSGDDAVRTVAIKGYLAAGSDHEARVQTLKSQLPGRYHDVVTLTVSQPEDAAPPELLPASPKNKG
jgi:hypothetical protein